MQYPTCPACKEKTPARDSHKFTCKHCGRAQTIVRVEQVSDISKAGRS